MTTITRALMLASQALCVFLCAWAVFQDPIAPKRPPAANTNRGDIQWFRATEEYLLPNSLLNRREHPSLPVEKGEPHPPEL